MATPAEKGRLVHEYGKRVDFGKTSDDYARFRPGPPPSMFDRLERFIPLRGCAAVDIGTGTGAAALELAARGACVTAIDRSEGQLAAGRAVAASRGLSIDFRVGSAESTGLPGGAFDLWIASQAWHWFDPAGAGAEALRLLRPRGLAVCCSFDYLPHRSPVAKATEDLILKYNPSWPMAGGHGCHINPIVQLPDAGLGPVEQFSFEHPQPFSHEAWRGRMRTCNGVGASLSEDLVRAFDRDLEAMLARDYGREPLVIWHRVWVVIAPRPGVPPAPA
jgi:SAM-dependent methyltransferase